MPFCAASPNKVRAIASLQDEAMVNTPEWLWERWGHVYGAEEAAHIATQHLAETAA